MNSDQQVGESTQEFYVRMEGLRQQICNVNPELVSFLDEESQTIFWQGLWDSSVKAALHSLKIKQQVQEFYKREDISREMPSRRFTTKAGSAYFMQISVKSAFKIFKKENEEISISLTRFQMLRPPRVKLLSLTKIESKIHNKHQKWQQQQKLL